ncbi:MAG: translocation/assembly module TamB domain-containing protein [Saccharospirillaceae bacterium]|nr:translocation/assembly module TamB domain-containing protein [Pseudomonadales bacterium]NRB79482.1 translocation/assembly module TamB domain-containing protein [Saccharospirillaceae bacterium]
MKNLIKKILKRLLYIVLAVFSGIVIVVLLVAFNSTVRESLLLSVFKYVDDQIEIENLQSPNLSTYHFSKLKYADIKIESGELVIRPMQLLVNVLYIEKLEIETLPLDFLFKPESDSAARNQPTKLDYSEFLDIKIPIDLVVESLTVNHLIADQNNVKVTGAITWSVIKTAPDLNLVITENDNYLNLKIDSYSKNGFKLNTQLKWDDFYGYKDIRQSLNSNVKILDNQLIKLDIKQLDLNFSLNKIVVNSQVNGNLLLDLNTQNQQIINLDAIVNNSVVDIDAQIIKQNVKAKVDVTEFDVSIIQVLLPDSDIAKHSEGKLTASFLIDGNIYRPAINANILLDAFVYDEIVQAEIKINTQDEIVILEADINSGFLETKVIADINVKNKKIDFNLDVINVNEKIKKLNLFKLDKPFVNTNIDIGGIIKGDADFSNELMINWQTKLSAKLQENEKYLDVELKADGDLVALSFSEIVISNVNNSLKASGEFEFKNIEMALDVQFELNNLDDLLWVNEILSDIDIQKKWVIQDYVDIYQQDVYEYLTLFQAGFKGDFDYLNQGDDLFLNEFRLNVNHENRLDFDFTSSSINLNTITAKNSTGYLNWKGSVFNLSGDVAWDDENNFNLEFSQVESDVVNPIIKFYEFNDYAIFDWQTTGEVLFTQKFENVNWDLNADVHLFKENRFINMDILANGDLKKLKIESLFASNINNSATVTGDYDIENFIIDVNADFDVNALFTIPWVSEVWIDEVLQEKWLLKENISDYKLNVPQSESILNSSAKGKLDILYSDDLFKLENMDLSVNSEFYNQSIHSEIKSKLMDINTMDLIGLDIQIKNDKQNIVILGDFSYELNNDLSLKFNNIDSILVFDVLEFYAVEKIDGVSFISSGDFKIDGLYQQPNLLLNLNNLVTYDGIPFDVELNLESSDLLSDLSANLILKLQCKHEKYPVNLVLESNYKQDVITISRLNADLLDSGYFSFKGRYENDFIEADLLAGILNVEYDYQFDIKKLNDFLINNLELDPMFFEIYGDVESSGSITGDILNLNWLSQIFVDSTVLTQIGVDPVNVKLMHNIKTNNNMINHELLFDLDQKNKLMLTGKHENNIESLFNDPMAVDWDMIVNFKGQINPLIKIIPDVDEQLFGDVLFDLAVSNIDGVLKSTGSGSVKKGRYLNDDLGLAVNQFSLSSQLNDKIVTLDIKAKDDSRGAINSKGRFELSKDILNSVYVEIEFLKAQLIDRPDVDSQLDGKIIVTGDVNQLLVSGDIIAKQTSIYLDKMQLVGVPQIIVSKKDQSQNAASAFFETINLDVNVSTDDKTKVSGRGVKMNLTGNATIQGNLDEPLIFAELNLLSGQFDLFTRIFEIEKGLVRMENDDVFVELQARHVRNSVEYVALISGVEGRYDIQLSSVPVYDQNQLISQLMFGKSIEKINAFQALRMAQALSYLNNNGSQYDVLKTTEDILDVDNIDIQTIDGVMQLLVGKYLNDRVYLQLGTSRSLDQSNVNGLLKIELNENLELKTYSGTNENSSGIELQWKNDY